MHPGGEGFRGMKRWPIERYIDLGLELVKRYGLGVLVLGGPDEVNLAQIVADAVPNAVSLAGELNLGQTIAILERCSVFVGNDSAPMHMAAAAGVPTVGIFGPTNVTNFRPRGPSVEVLRAGLACSPCFHFAGSHPFWAASHCKVPSCLHAISKQVVLDSIARYVEAD
jgi:ADP-heptose:LPS heptosyltransferase